MTQIDLKQLASTWRNADTPHPPSQRDLQRHWLFTRLVLAIEMLICLTALGVSVYLMLDGALVEGAAALAFVAVGAVTGLWSRGYALTQPDIPTDTYIDANRLMEQRKLRLHMLTIVNCIAGLVFIAVLLLAGLQGDSTGLLTKDQVIAVMLVFLAGALGRSLWQIHRCNAALLALTRLGQSLETETP